jgi:outer membrane protein
MSRDHRRAAGRRALAILGLSVLVAAVLPASAPAADLKPLGVINSQRIVEEYDAARDAQEQYQKFLRDLEREIEEKERSLQRLMEDIESQKMFLTEDALGTRMQEFENQKADYFEFRDQADGRAEQEYKAKIGPIIDQVKTIAERIGKEEGYGLVIDTAALTVLYLDSSVDLTDKVLAALVRGED